LTTHRPEYDEQSLSIIADILGTLYSNPRRSVLREYIANGLDAHREAGVDKPLRVVLPTSQSQRLVIQDFGNGLSPRELHRVFFSYGRSTKWDAQDAIGMFGIGAKSAYSLSQTWEVRSVHEGMSYVAVAYNENGPAFRKDPLDSSQLRTTGRMSLLRLLRIVKPVWEMSMWA
jgi:HSP90 family molecular chaperone